MVRGLGYSQGKTRDQEAFDIASSDWVSMTTEQLEFSMSYMFRSEIEILIKTAKEEYAVLMKSRREITRQFGGDKKTFNCAINHVRHVIALCNEQLQIPF